MARPSPAPSNAVVPESVCAECDKILKSAAATQAIIDQCKACGFPNMDEYDAINAQHRDFATATKGQFFPHRT